MNLTRSPVPVALDFARRLGHCSGEEVLDIQRKRLTELLLHAWRHKDYYHALLSEHGVVEDGVVRLDRFTDIPVLTKELIRANGPRMRASLLMPPPPIFQSPSLGLCRIDTWIPDSSQHAMEGSFRF